MATVHRAYRWNARRRLRLAGPSPSTNMSTAGFRNAKATKRRSHLNQTPTQTCGPCDTCRHTNRLRVRKSHNVKEKNQLPRSQAPCSGEVHESVRKPSYLSVARRIANTLQRRGGAHRDKATKPQRTCVILAPHRKGAVVMHGSHKTQASDAPRECDLQCRAGGTPRNRSVSPRTGHECLGGHTLMVGVYERAVLITEHFVDYWVRYCAALTKAQIVRYMCRLMS